MIHHKSVRTQGLPNMLESFFLEHTPNSATLATNSTIKEHSLSTASVLVNLSSVVFSPQERTYVQSHLTNDVRGGV